jgi:hypothetical protein
MTTLEDLDTAVQELRVEADRSAFTHTLGHIVGVLGAMPSWPPGTLTPAGIERLRTLADEVVDAIERRIDSAEDSEDVQQRLAGTVYEVRKRMESRRDLVPAPHVRVLSPILVFFDRWWCASA